MPKDVLYGKTLRKSFARTPEIQEMPNLLEIQKSSYKWFLETNWDKLATEDCMAIQRRIGQLISDINDIQRLREEQQ